MQKREQTRAKPYLAAFFAIFIAVFAVLFVSVVSGVGNAMIETELDGLGLNGLTVSGIFENKLRIQGESVLEALEAQEQVGSISPATYETIQVHMAGQDQSAVAWGIGPQADDIIALNILHGRMLSVQEAEQGERVCLVDEALAMASYGRANIVGKTIQLTLNGTPTPFQVIGVVQAGSSVLSGIAGEVVPNFIYLPYTALLQYGYKKGIDQIALQPAAGHDTEEVKSVIAKLYPTQETGLRVNDLAQQKEKITGIVSIASWALGALAVIALLVAGISVLSSVSTAVMVRRKEIGIKKAMGASVPVLVWEFLREIFWVAATGAFLGLLTSGTAAVLALQLFHLPKVFNMQLIVIGVLATMVLALIFGAFPVVKAARLRPVEALNRE